LHAAKLATPDTVASGFVVHVNVAPAVPVPAVIDNDTLAELVVTVFPNPSWIATLGWIVHATPPVPPLGCSVNPTCTAGPADTVNTPLVTLVSPVLDATRV
jgi:hypothetical protein